ncbi:MAG: DUF3024 domain-containing protein, partial [Nitrospirales bacterium]|nr:DUF3024 domain-containing protein [Nitrospirales bacterium]
GNSATLYEERQAFGRKDVWVDIVIAQFRFNIMTREWTLYFADRNSRWRPYSDACPTSNFDVLLNEVDKDGRGIFWG